MYPPVEISIVTPSRNMLPYLQRAAASVADQEGVRAEHLVIDALSDDGTAEWLAGRADIRSLCEADRGMYDAVNKGLKLARGSILAYLNCDEQYLPGVLATVRDVFARSPEIDLLFGDLLLIRPDGSLLAFRKGYPPRWPYILASHLYVLTCAMFFRRRLVDEGMLFHPDFRDSGDMEWVVRVLRSGYRARHVRRYLAAFTMTGGNLSSGERARAEHRRLVAGAPWPVRFFRTPLNAARLTEKFCHGAYCQRRPLRYQVYTGGTRRESLVADDPSFVWRRG